MRELSRPHWLGRPPPSVPPPPRVSSGRRLLLDWTKRDSRRGLPPGPYLSSLRGRERRPVTVWRRAMRVTRDRPREGLSRRHHRPAVHRRPGRICPRAVAPANRCGRPQARPGASHEVLVPYSVRWPRRAARCCRHPGDPAAAFPTRPAIGPDTRPPHTLVRPAIRGRWRDGVCALAVFRLRPRPAAAPGAVPGSSALTTAAHPRAPARTGHAPPLSLPAGVPLPAASRRATWPGPRHYVRPRRRSWGSTLRGLAPARGCRDVSAPRTHLPFSRLAPPDPLRMLGRAAGVLPPTCWRRHRPRAPAAAPGLRPRGRSVPCVAARGGATRGRYRLGLCLSQVFGSTPRL